MRLKTDINDVKKHGEDSAGDAAMQLAALRGQVRGAEGGGDKLIVYPCRFLGEQFSLVIPT